MPLRCQGALHKQPRTVLCGSPASLFQKRRRMPTLCEVYTTSVLACGVQSDGHSQHTLQARVRLSEHLRHAAVRQQRAHAAQHLRTAYWPHVPPQQLQARLYSVLLHMCKAPVTQALSLASGAATGLLFEELQAHDGV